MKVVQRPELNVRAAPCVECGAITRSHVLELPDYEEYEEAPAEDPDGDEFVIRYQQLNDAKVMCHKCWMPLKQKAVNSLNKNLDSWLSDTSSNLRRINRFFRQWRYYDFDHECDEETWGSLKKLSDAVREAVK